MAEEMPSSLLSEWAAFFALREDDAKHKQRGTVNLIREPIRDPEQMFAVFGQIVGNGKNA